MDNNTQQTRGFGVILFNEDSTAAGYIGRAAEDRLCGRGVWSKAGVVLNGPNFRLEAKPCAQPQSGRAGPRMRGELTFLDTGEHVRICAWLNEDMSYGVSENAPLETSPRAAPF